MTRPDFEALIVAQLRPLVKFARWLGAGEPEDAVHDTVVRLAATGAYLKYQDEPGADRISAWLRRAVQNTLLATETKRRRRQRILREDLDERVHVGEVILAVDGGDDGDAGTGELDLGGWSVDQVVADEDLDHEVRLYTAVLAALEQMPPEVATALRMRGAGRTWAEIGLAVEVPTETIKKRVQRALPGLRANVERRSPGAVLRQDRVVLGRRRMRHAQVGAAPTYPTTPDGRKLKHKYNVPESRWMGGQAAGAAGWHRALASGPVARSASVTLRSGCDVPLMMPRHAQARQDRAGRCYLHSMPTYRWILYPSPSLLQEFGEEFMLRGARLRVGGNSVEIDCDDRATAQGIIDRYVDGLRQRLPEIGLAITEEEFLLRPAEIVYVKGLSRDERDRVRRVKRELRNDLLQGADAALRRCYDYLQNAREREDGAIFELYKAIETIEDALGGEGRAGQVLGVAREIKALKRVANERTRDERHAPKDPASTPPRADLRQAWENTLAVVRAYEQHLLHARSPN